MNYLKNSLVNTMDFLKNTMAYFRDVLLLHGFMLFVLLPFLSNLTKFILRRGNIDYLSSDTFLIIFTKHPIVLISLLLVLVAILLTTFFEFTFLLLSVFFIKKKQLITLQQLLKGTFLQIKKVRVSTIVYFLFYFLLILPLSGLGFHSDLLSKIKIPAFILDFIFANRVIIIASVILFYLLLILLAIRLIFGLPEMILRDIPFKQAVKDSWQTTKSHFFKILGQFIFIGGSILLFSWISYSLVFIAQASIEAYLPQYALAGAVVAMSLLQFFWLLNIILSTVSIFYIIVDYMDDHDFLPEIPKWYSEQPSITKKSRSFLQTAVLAFLAILFGIGVGVYNTNYLRSFTLSQPITLSHRGVDNGNGVQNSIDALVKTSKEKPTYIEMDIQETKDKQFVVYHDFNLKALTGINKRPNQLTLEELTKITVKENGLEQKIAPFDQYLEAAKEIHQPLLIEVKTTPQDSSDLVDRFIEQYRETILTEGHIIHTLDFDAATQLKKKEPKLFVGYVLPFNIIGPPVSNVDFFTMEYTTLNQNFVNAAHKDGKQVFTWTPNDEDTMTRMMIYGVDGIVTDQLSLLNETIHIDLDQLTYSDKLLHFVIGIG